MLFYWRVKHGLVDGINHRRTVCICTGILRQEYPIDVGKSSEFFVQDVLIVFVKFESLSPSEKTPVLEHVECLRMESPVCSLARSIWPPWHLDEAVVKAKVVAK